MHILYVCAFSCVRCRSHITKSLRPLWFIAAPALERPAPSSRGHAESQEPRETWDSERKQGSHSWSAACPGCGFRMRHAISSSGVRHNNNNNIIISACTVNLSKPYRIRAECVFSVFFPVGPGGGGGFKWYFSEISEHDLFGVYGMRAPEAISRVRYENRASAYRYGALFVFHGRYIRFRARSIKSFSLRAWKHRCTIRFHRRRTVSRKPSEYAPIKCSTIKNVELSTAGYTFYNSSENFAKR